MRDGCFEMKVLPIGEGAGWEAAFVVANGSSAMGKGKLEQYAGPRRASARGSSGLRGGRGALR